eukprot:Tamp_07369.p3 GENE.Tamp_07369~~Tamp_07369.p3  ORF type:complete len:207 (+),score=31.64 Tamp_07369:23-643(+)
MGSRSGGGRTPNVFRAQATGDEAKIWHHLFKALARVGQDFCLDVDDRKVSMRTINSGQSAYATASFPKTFFREYSISGTVEPCKILLKPMCAVFKFASTVEEFSIALDCDKSELSVVLACKDGIIKRFRVLYETSERQMAVYDKSRCQNRLRAMSARDYEAARGSAHCSRSFCTQLKTAGTRRGGCSRKGKRETSNSMENHAPASA